MVHILTPVAALLFGVALLLTGNGLQGTFLPLRAHIEAFDTLAIGTMGSAYFGGFVLGCFYGPRVIRRAGHIRAFTALTAIASTTALAHALVVEPLFWTALRAISGFYFAGLFMVIESWLNDQATNATRGRIFAGYTAINLTVITLGQMMITVYDPAGFPLFVLTSILISLAAVPVALTRSAGPAPVGAVELRPGRLYTLSPVGLVGAFAVGLANGAFWSLGPAYARTVGLDIAEVAYFMSGAVLAGALTQFPVGRASDGTDRRVVIGAASLLAAAAGGAMVLADVAWPELRFPAVIAFGACAYPIYALCAAHTNDFVPPGEFVQAAGGLLLANGIGSTVGPLVAATAMDASGPGGLFLHIGAVYAVFALFAAYRITRRAAPTEEKTGFVAIPRNAPTAFELDPRGDAPER